MNRVVGRVRPPNDKTRVQMGKASNKDQMQAAVKDAVQALRDIKDSQGNSAFDGLSTEEKREAVAMYLTSDSDGNSDPGAMKQVLNALNIAGATFQGGELQTTAALEISSSSLGSGTTQTTKIRGNVPTPFRGGVLTPSGNSLSHDVVNITVRNNPNIARDILKDVGGGASLF